MYPLFETIKVQDGKLCNLKWHQRRLDRSYSSFFQRNNIHMLDACIKIPEDASEGIYKCRFRYNASGFETTFERYMPKKIRRLKLVEADDVDYSLKYSDRKVFEDLLIRKEDCDDILIIKEGLLTDTSYSNVAFFNGKNWFTPAKPLLRGTQVDRLIHEGKLVEKDIRPMDIEQFETCRLINAMLGFDSVNDLGTENLVY